MIVVNDWIKFYVSLIEFEGFRLLFVVCIFKINVVELVDVIKNVVIK